MGAKNSFTTWNCQELLDKLLKQFMTIAIKKRQVEGIPDYSVSVCCHLTTLNAMLSCLYKKSLLVNRQNDVRYCLSLRL